MKNCVLIIFVFLTISVSAVYGQNLLEKYPVVLSSKEKIDNDTSLRKLTLSNEEFMEHVDHGGELIGFYKDSVIVKVSVILYYSHGVERVNYYLEEKRVVSLSFMDETFDMYPYNEETNEFDYSKTERNFHGQYLFKDNKLIDQISTGHNRLEDDTIDIDRTVNSELIFYLDMISKKNAL